MLVQALFITAGCLVFLAALIGLFIMLVAKRDVANAPRRDMYICPTHGPMPVSATITLMDGELDQITEDGRTVRAPLRSCPMCFESAIKKAKG